MLDNLTNDGGQWNVFVNLINKYGIIPKSAMDDHYHSKNSDDLNEFFNDFLRKSAHKIRTSNINKFKLINELLEECYKILVLFLGEPPQVINWDYYATKDDSNKTVKKKTKKNKENKNQQTKEAKDDSKKIYKVVENISPLNFYKKFVPYDANNKVCLINYPCDDHKYYKLYNVELAFNLTGNKQQNFINVPIEVMIEATKKSIDNSEAVWTGIDYGKYTASKEGFLDIDGFNYKDIFEFNNLMDKCDSLNYRQSYPNHAVILRGYNFEKGNTNGFLVENSHGNGINEENEFNENLYMSLKWFKQFVYMIVVDKKYVSSKELKVLKQKPIVMPYWSPFGSLLNGGSKFKLDFS
jgi:bleomycin hydrolase